MKYYWNKTLYFSFHLNTSSIFLIILSETLLFHILKSISTLICIFFFYSYLVMSISVQAKYSYSVLHVKKFIFQFLLSFFS